MFRKIQLHLDLISNCFPPFPSIYGSPLRYKDNVSNIIIYDKSSMNFNEKINLDSEDGVRLAASV